MDIPLHKLNYSFSKKPLLIGGKAMEFYGLRKSGDDIDLVVTEEDFVNLLVVDEIIKRQFAKYDDIKARNEHILKKVGSVTVIEKQGPEENEVKIINQQ